MEPTKRKPNRLKEYDYSQTGSYFITICTINREPILSTITVGDGSAVPQFQYASVPQQTSTSIPHVTLSPLGQIVEEYIHMIPEKYPNIIIDTYVIMPDHIHMILSIVSHNTTHGRANPAPTIGNIIGWFKFITTKMMANYWNTPDYRFWQRSYHDHIIRNEQEYLYIYQYIRDNPARWLHKYPPT